MRILVAGAHGQVGLRLGRLLAGRGDTVVGVVRNPAHAGDLRAAGVEPYVLDLERAGVDEVAAALEGAEAAVFSAGAGPGSGDARKETVDRAAAVLLADACTAAGCGATCWCRRRAWTPSATGRRRRASSRCSSPTCAPSSPPSRTSPSETWSGRCCGRVG